jgi:hypothetical protein
MSNQQPVQTGAHELRLAAAEAAKAKRTTDHDGDGKMGGMKGVKPKAKGK